MGHILDGNNILGLIKEGPGGRGDRERLLEHLLSLGLPAGSMVVFDGPPPQGRPSEGRRGRVIVVYSGGATADSVIAKLAGPGDVVVTRDRELALACRDRRASVQAPDAFLSALRSKKKRPAAEKPAPSSVDVEGWMEYFRRGGGGGKRGR